MARLLFFGQLGDLAGGIERSMTLSEPQSVSGIITLIEAGDRLLGSALTGPRVRYAVNGVMVDAAAPVRDGDELAFLPPVSGG